MKIKPLNLTILFKPEKPEEKTKSGLIIRTEAQAEKEGFNQNVGILIDVGANAFHDWDASEKPKIGDKILTVKYPGLTKEIDGEMYRICDYTDVLAIVGE